MGIKKSIKQQNSKQRRHIAPKSKEFRSLILRKVIDKVKHNSLNIWILDNPKIWGTHLNRREVVMRCPCTIDWQFSRPAQLIFPSGASLPIGNIRTHRVRVEMIFGGLPCRRSLTPRVSPSRVPVLSFAHYFQGPATQAMWKRNPGFLESGIPRKIGIRNPGGIRNSLLGIQNPRLSWIRLLEVKNLCFSCWSL